MAEFKYVKTSKLGDGRKTFHYETEGGRHKVEIDELRNADNKFTISLCSVSGYMNTLDTYAKTRQTLLRRLDTLFD